MKKLYKSIWGLVYYLFARHLPHYTMFYSLGLHKIRNFVGRQMFIEAGKRIKIGQGALIGSGDSIQIGDDSSIGKDCIVNNVKIGKAVMMGEGVIMFAANHKHDNTDIPMINQGMDSIRTLIIEDDVWLGARCIILPSVKRIGKGSIIGAGAVITKDIPEYAIVGGNPARILKYRR